MKTAMVAGLREVEGEEVNRGRERERGGGRGGRKEVGIGDKMIGPLSSK